jgi:hypothetical protein
MRLPFALIALGVASVAPAWSASGHMACARIAYEELDAMVRIECDRLLQIGKTERAYDFVTASAWADDTRTDANGRWHYTNIHFRTDGKPTFEMAEEENVVTAIARFSREVRNRALPDEQRADALRYLIHFVADVHQPLHATARDSDAFPNGDRGGNDFAILPPDGFDAWRRPPTNLHSLWDSGCGLLPPVERPLVAEGQRWLDGVVAKLRAEHPRKRYKLAVYEPTVWALESFEDAKKHAYRLKEGSKPGRKYLENGQRVSARRLAVAGYRLADLLNHLLGSARP